MSDQGPELAATLAPGMISLIADASGEHVAPAVVVRFADGAASVVPLSPAVQYASEWDLTIPVEVLGYAAIAQVWNYGTILAEQSRELVATLSPPNLAALQQLVSAAAAGGAAPDDLPVGPPVLDDNEPRLLFQESQAEEAHVFWEPALALAGAATLGELLRHRREDLAIATSELEAHAGETGWIAGVEDDSVDPRQALPARALASVLRCLELGVSTRLRTLVRTTLEGHQPQFARDLTGNRPPAVDVDAYLDAVFDELGQDRQ
jgi:hypothetical protein